MAERLHTFSESVLHASGVAYRAHVVGRVVSDGSWEGWLEFEPLSGGKVARTDRETTQAERGDLVYWAAGLEPVYLEGALRRALAG